MPGKVVAFLDVLGFKSLDIEQQKETLERISSWVNLLAKSEIWMTDRKTGKEEFRYRFFEGDYILVVSDSILVVVDPDPVKVARLINSVADLCKILLFHSWRSALDNFTLIRGGIAFGEVEVVEQLYIDRGKEDSIGILFPVGPGYLGALNLEGKGKGPRIFMDKQVLEIAKQAKGGHLPSFLSYPNSIYAVPLHEEERVCELLWPNVLELENAEPYFILGPLLVISLYLWVLYEKHEEENVRKQYREFVRLVVASFVNLFCNIGTGYRVMREARDENLGFGEAWDFLSAGSFGDSIKASLSSVERAWDEAFQNQERLRVPALQHLGEGERQRFVAGFGSALDQSLGQLEGKLTRIGKFTLPELKAMLALRYCASVISYIAEEVYSRA